jgi:hypothetical protein
MNGLAKRALIPALATGAVLAGSAPALAQPSGAETLSGFIAASNTSGTREVVSSGIVAKGAFSGIGRVVEIPNLPSDSENVSRDDLVFAGGAMHLLTTNGDTTFSIDPRTCIGTFKIQQTQAIQGGTGRFSHASGTFAGTLTGRGLATRNPDGSCNAEQGPQFELDTFTTSGSLTL